MSWFQARRSTTASFCRSGALGAKLDNYNPGLLLLASLDGIHWSLRRQPCFLHHWQRSPPPMRLQSPLEFAPKAEV